ncbi:MAG: hypothetical protein LUC45_06925 [Paraprevotella sp.]|nr:hypothetical protein [Paraprevotella sp.]
MCNVLAVMSIGILCDDVFIYNQGLSFYKYDQAGTYTPNRGESIDNDGLTDFLGNLVPVVADDDRGAYGQLGQMQESGRDQGHATMAAGLAVDICQIAYNQGDDLYSYMDNRLAAGLEFIAAYNNGGVEAEDLPWTTYRYADCRTAWHNAWVQTGPNPGERGAARPYWGRVIGHYEGVKGVKMKYSEMALEQMGIDGGGLGGTSGGYDHLGYSVLTCTRDAITPDQAPTLLTPLMEYNGTSVEHNELGGLRNTYLIEPTTALPAGTLVTLSPQLPKGTADTGQWKWNTGEHTKDLTVAANRSKVYRVTYTNANGVESEQVFTLAVEGDCAESEVETYITTNGVRTAGDSATVMYGDAVTLEIYGRTGWGYYSWENGATTATVTLPAVTTSRDISAFFISQGGRKNKVTFHLNVQSQRPDFILNGQTYTDSLVVIAAAGSDVTLAPTPSDAQTYGTWQWSDGSTASSLTLENLQTSGEYTVRYTVDETTYSCTYRIYVKDENYRLPEAGDYYIRYLPDDTYLTNLNGTGTSPVFAVRNEASPSSQQWHIENTSGVSTYSIQSLRDSTGLNKEGTLVARPLKAFRFSGVAGSDRLAIQKSVTSGPKYWYVKADGSIDFAATEDATDYPFELIAVEGGNSINQPTADGNKKITAVTYYTPGGIRMNHPSRGINIRQTIYADGETKQDKIVIR